MPRKEKTVYAIDCETDPFKYGRRPEPFSWGIWSDDDYAEFWGDDATEQFIEYTQDISNAIFYAHNGGKFDFFYLLPWLDPNLFIINGRIAKATMNNGAIELRDSWLILPMPLAVHGKVDIEYSKMEKESRQIHKREILNYLREDCRSLFDWVSAFRSEFGGGLTLAGTAFKQLRKTSYPIESTFESFDDTLRPFYFGGRVQCFKTGAFKGELKYVDINSAYPYAMTFKHWQGSSYRQVLKIPSGENGSWFATVKAVSKGALPFKGADGKLYFPDDDNERTYSASGWEILAGLDTGTLKINKIVTCYVPTFKADFCEYVDKFFAMKLEADKKMEELGERHPDYKYWKTKRQFAKLMLNSCYGKFGQDGREFEKFTLCPFGELPEAVEKKDGTKQEWEFYASTEFLLDIYKRPDPVNRFYNVATAASITGFVRAYLWRAICQSQEPLYCDTDSIICREFNGVIGDKLGEWALEAEATEAYIAQRKMYALLTTDGKHKIASKGVRLTFDQIKTGVLTGRNIVTEKEAPAFSLRFGTRFLARTTDFKNIEKNACNNPAA